MAGIYDMAKDLGGALARTDEYQALKASNEAVEEDRELVEIRNRIQGLEERLEASMRAGQEPDEELKTEYGEAASQLQSKPAFQRVVAAQANFEKIMYKVNETMAQGLREGGNSRIIISS